MVELLASKTRLNKNHFRKSIQTTLMEEEIKMMKSMDQEGIAVEMKEEIICTTKMGEVKEENEKLKQLISNVVKDYKSLQTHFFQVLQQDQTKNLKPEEINISDKEINEDPLLVSLSLGRTNSIDSSSDSIKQGKRGFDSLSNGLSLGLDSFEESKKQEPGKVLKTIRSSLDEQTSVKKARVSIRTRCDSQTMNDGCQWRKYGQKVAKGNPCPRAYYRCTISPTCPVRKQVQRCAEDMSILVTTYEGTHNHPLPSSATAMASTTSAAESMLKSHSSQSKLGSSILAPLSNSIFTPTSGALNFNSSNWNQDQFYISKANPSMSTLNSHPTITLDLTNYNFSQYSSPKLPSLTPSFSPSCTNLNFSSNSSSNHYNFDTTSWNSSAYNNYGTILQHDMVANSSRKQQDIYKSYNMQMVNTSTVTQQESLKESIAAATKMIASNPNFQSALVAAISSYVGCKGGNNVKENHGIANLDHSI